MNLVDKIKGIIPKARPTTGGNGAPTGRRGVSLLELTITIGLTAIIIAPTAAIVWQVTVAPIQTTQATQVVASVRNVDLSIPDDGRAAQEVVTGENPVWAVSTWNDFTGEVTEYHRVQYTWDSEQETMVRIDTTDGNTSDSTTVTRFMDQFADADISFNSLLTPFLLQTTVFPEVDSGLGSVAVRTGSLVSFLRSPRVPPRKDGGYTIFGTSDIILTGDDNSIIGNIHSNTKVLICGDGNRSVGFVDSSGGVTCVDDEDEQETEDVLYLHNRPRPPAGGETTFFGILADDNGDPNGIASYTAGFLVLDKSDRKIYKYDTAGLTTGSFDLDSSNSDARGVSTDGITVWVVDKNDRKVYAYDLSGNHFSAADFDLDNSNRDARGIGAAGSKIWIVDQDDEKVYTYTFSGNHLGAEDFDLDDANEEPEGSSGPHHQDSGEAKIRESTAGVSRKPSSDCKACGCSSKHLCGLTAWNT